jgi:hypothetical protein
MIGYRSLIALILLTRSFTVWGSDAYWAYTYKGIDVTATGSAERAKEIAHHLHRLDLAMGILLGLQAQEWRPPTRVYVVPQATFDLLLNKSRSQISSVYYGSNFSSDILIDISVDRDTPYFDAYHGYSSGVLVSAYPMRFPFWYSKGFAQVFGASRMNLDKVVLGDFILGRTGRLFGQDWIPVKTLFSIQRNDPQLASAPYAALYEAECWLLVHQILIEQIHSKSFSDYLSRLDAGEDPSAAFTESFSISYQELDEELHHALKRGRINLANIKVAEEPDNGEPRRLSESEAKGRSQLANEALAGDSKNEDALIALARVQLRKHDWPSALLAAQRVCMPGLSSEYGAGQCGIIYAQLLYTGASKDPSSGIEAHALADQSRNYYETALRLDPEDLEAWSGMGALLINTRDVDKAKSFLPRAKHAWAMHSTNENLARQLSGLCALTGDFDTAIKFAQVWQKYALTGESSVAADAYLSRLRTRAEQKLLTDPPRPEIDPAASGTAP